MDKASGKYLYRFIICNALMAWDAGSVMFGCFFVVCDEISKFCVRFHKRCHVDAVVAGDDARHWHVDSNRFFVRARRLVVDCGQLHELERLFYRWSRRVVHSRTGQ